MGYRSLVIFVLLFPFLAKANLTGHWQGPGQIKISHGVGSSEDILNCYSQLAIVHEETTVVMEHLTFFCKASEFKDGPFNFEIKNGELLKNGKNWGTISENEMDILDLKGGSLSNWNFKKKLNKIKATIYFIESGFKATLNADLEKLNE